MKPVLFILIFILAVNLSGQNVLQERSALNFSKQGEYEKAINLYNKLLEKDPDNPKLLYNLGTTYLLKKDPDKSIDFLQKASATDDMNILEKAYYNLGNAYYEKKEYGNAVGAYKKALKINAQNQDARENLELSLRSQKEQQKQQQNQSNKNKNIEPSEFAKKLKKMAEQMVLKRNYSGAYQLMMDGLKKDKTVQAFSDMIGRLKTVAEINGK